MTAIAARSAAQNADMISAQFADNPTSAMEMWRERGNTALDYDMEGNHEH